MTAPTLQSCLDHNDLEGFRECWDDSSARERKAAVLAAAGDGKSDFLAYMCSLKGAVTGATKTFAFQRAIARGDLASVKILSGKTLNDNRFLSDCIVCDQLPIYAFLVSVARLDNGIYHCVQRAANHDNRSYLDVLLAAASQRYDWTLVNDIFQHCISQVGQQGHSVKLAYLLNHPLRPSNENLDLLPMIYAGNETCIEMSVPHASVEVCTTALLYAVQKNFTEVARVLLPKANTLYSNCLALRTAVAKGNIDLIELLVPHSDSKKVLKDLKEHNSSHWELLEQAVLRNTLRDVVGSSGSPPTVKKM